MIVDSLHLICGEFVLGAPQVEKATLHLKNNKTFIMETTNFSKEYIYRENCRLNGGLL